MMVPCLFTGECADPALIARGFPRVEMPACDGIWRPKLSGDRADGLAYAMSVPKDGPITFMTLSGEIMAIVWPLERKAWVCRAP